MNLVYEYDAQLEKLVSALKKIYGRKIKILSVQFGEYNKGELTIMFKVDSFPVKK